MSILTDNFRERRDEIDAHLHLLEAVDVALRTGPPVLAGTIITARQQKILYSTIYLQLYNLVEATVTWLVDAICDASSKDGAWRVSDLSAELQKEWVRAKARTSIELNPENRLQHALELTEHLIQSAPISAWSVEKGRRGNWDDDEIRAITGRLGCPITLSQQVYSDIKRPLRDEKGALALVRDLRNRLAHGSLSFAECGDGVTVAELRELAERTSKYLEEIVSGVEAYIESYAFLIPQSRPPHGVRPE